MRQIFICAQDHEGENLTMALVKALFPECGITLVEGSAKSFSHSARVNGRVGAGPQLAEKDGGRLRWSSF